MHISTNFIITLSHANRGWVINIFCATACPIRFGVIHAVFTNLLLWCNGVMSESEHFLNNHMRRLSALGYGNLTIGKGLGVDCRLVPGGKVQ